MYTTGQLLASGVLDFSSSEVKLHRRAVRVDTLPPVVDTDPRQLQANQYLPYTTVKNASAQYGPLTHLRTRAMRN